MPGKTFIPLGGNRVSLPKQVRNIAVVWLLTGFWHGANWNYVLWGVYFGVFLVIEKFFLAKYLKRLPKVVSHIYQKMESKHPPKTNCHIRISGKIKIHLKTICCNAKPCCKHGGIPRCVPCN